MRWFRDFIRQLGERMKRQAPVGDMRPQSIRNIDSNATQAAANVQTASDANDRRAGAPAEQGGEA